MVNLADHPQPPKDNDIDVQRFATLAYHEETVLNDRLNIFLVVESILLVFAVEAGSQSPLLKLFAVGGGLAITVCWCLTSVRQYLDLRHAVVQLRKSWPGLVEAYAPIPQWLKDASLVAMLLVLPGIFIVLWAAIYFYLPAPFAAN